MRDFCQILWYISFVAGECVMQLERKEFQSKVRRTRYFGGIKSEMTQTDLSEFNRKSPEEKLASGAPTSIIPPHLRSKPPRPNHDWLKQLNSKATVKDIETRLDFGQKPTIEPPAKRRALYTQTPCYSARRLLEEPAPH
jgi:hypothetical protein